MEENVLELAVLQQVIVPIRPAVDLEKIKNLVLSTLNSEHSRRAYGRVLTDFLSWFQAQPDPFTKATVQTYVSLLGLRTKRRGAAGGLAPSTRNIAIAAIRRLAFEASDNGLLDPAIAAGIGRIKGVRMLGTRTGNWLTVDQAERLLDAPARSTLKGRRDRALLAAMIGCGMRRSEISDVTFEHIQQRDGRWVVADLVGKHGRVRTIPAPSWFRALVDDWARAADISTGRIFHSLNNRGELSRDRLLGQNMQDVVRRYGAVIGMPKLAPHDLRRTFAKLAHKGKAPIEQISLSLGHSSIQTTEKYLGVRQDLTDAPCDHLGLRVETGDEPAE